MFFKKYQTLSICLIASNFALALSNLPGAIPLKYERRPSTDLVYQGNKILPSQAHKLHLQGIDLSNLNPAQSDIWKNTQNKITIDKLNLEINKPLKFIDDLVSRSGNYRFTVRQENSKGELENYVILVSKNRHDFLLRKNLLQKLGYVVPKTQYLKSIEIEFNGEFSKKIFKENLAHKTFGDPTRWITNETQNSIQLQDVIAFSANELTYNLAMGTIPDEVVQGRRVFRSLLLPFSLVETQESINLLPWAMGRVFNDYAIVSYSESESLRPSYADTKWMLNKLAKLKRVDFQEIVKKSFLPQEVAMLLTEKIIARNNALQALFKTNYKPSDFDPHVTMGENLVSGLLQKQWWDGYGSRFAFGEPASPLSSSEVRNFFFSKGISSVIENLTVQLNDSLIPGTDIQQKIIDEQISAAKDQFRNFLETGEVKEVPFGTFTFPTFSGYAGVSRNVLAGNYLGTENIIQLADGMSYSLGTGIVTSAVGLPQDLLSFIGAKARLSRSYTHLRPIRSIKKAIKTPYKNMLIPLMNKQKLAKFDELYTTEFYEQDLEKQKEQVSQVMKVFLDNLDVGESFIISDNIEKTIALNGVYALNQVFQLQNQLNSARRSIKRVHVVRSDKETIQIYRGDASLNLRGFQIGLNAYLPIISFGTQKQKGKVETQFYQISFNNDSENIDVNQVIKNISALKAVLLDRSFELIKQQQKPYIIKQNLSERVNEFKFLLFRNEKVKSNQEITIQHPNGFEKTFFRNAIGERRGKDYQGLSVDIVNAIIAEQLDQDLYVPNPSSGNAGDTYKGRSVTQQLIVETEHTNNLIESPFASLKLQWKGWSASKKRLKNIIKDAHKKIGHMLFDESILYGLEEIQLYNLSFDMMIYEDAISNITEIGLKELVIYIDENGKWPMPARLSSESSYTYAEKVEKKIRRIIKKLRNLKNDISTTKDLEDAKAYSSKLVEYLTLIESLVSTKHFIHLLGGEDNIFLVGNLNGFRVGQENGDSALIANTIGKIGHERPRGGLYSVQNKMNISEGELFTYWLLRRL